MSIYRSIFESESSAGALADKLDNDFSGLWNSTTGLNQLINTKLDITTYNSGTNSINTSLNNKVDNSVFNQSTTGLNELINTKLDISVYNSGTNGISTSLNNKVDNSVFNQVTSGLNLYKADVDGSNLTSLQAQSLGNKLKIPITSITNYYVETIGNDNNNGLSSTSAFATLSKAFQVLSGSYVKNFVNINIGSGAFSVDGNAFDVYSSAIEANTSVNNRLINIIGAMVDVATNVVITNITGRANIRNYSGVTLATNEAKGYYLKTGTTYYPVAGNDATTIYVSGSLVAGTYTLCRIGTELTFTNLTFIRKKIETSLCFKNLTFKGSVPNSVWRPQLSGYVFDECNFMVGIGIGNGINNEFWKMLRCNFIRTGLSAVQWGLPIIVTDSNFIDGVIFSKNIKNINIDGGIIFHNNTLGDLVQGNNISSASSTVLSMINTSGSNLGIFYNISNCTFGCFVMETLGTIPFTQLGPTTYGTNMEKSFDILIKSYSSLYPLTITVPDKSLYPMTDLNKGRYLSIEGVSPIFQPVLSFDTIAEVNTLNSTNDSIFCSQTGKMYKYSTSGSAYNIDNVDILATSSGGDTRFISIDYEKITMPQIGSISGDLTGFDPQYPVINTFNDTNRTLTVTPQGTNFFDVYYEGVKYRKQSESLQIDDLEGIHLIFYNSLGVLSYSHGPVDDFIVNNIPICIIWWDSVNKRHIRKASELHGVNRDRFLHRYIHLVFGTGYSDGLGVDNITVGDGSLDSHLYVGVGDGTIYDEDLKIPIINNFPQQLQNLNAPVFYLDGSDWRATTSSLIPYITGTNGLLSYNHVENGFGTQKICNDNTYLNYNLFATFDDEYPIVWIQGRQNYNSLSYATQNIHYIINELLKGAIPFLEFTPIGAITLKVNSSFANSKKAAIVLNNDGEKYHDLRMNYKLNRYPEKIVTWNEKYIIVDSEQGKGDFINLKDAVEWFNSHASSNLEIKINPGIYYIDDTITIDNPLYSMVINGSGIGITMFSTTSGLNGSPMIVLNSPVSIGHVSFDANITTNYGTGIGENAIVVNCAGNLIFTYVTFYRFFNGMEINNNEARIWMTMSKFSNCVSNGIRYLNGTLELGMVEFDNNSTGLHIESGTNSMLVISNSLFGVNNGQYGIRYERADVEYDLFSVIGNSFVGSGTYGFGFDYSNPIDADIRVMGNTGLIDNSPKAYIQFKNNITNTVCTTQNTYYKVAGANTSSNTRKFTIGDNRATYQPSITRNLTIFITGNIAATTNNRTFSIGVYKNGNILLEETEVRIVDGNQYYSFAINTEVEIVNTNDFFEIWVSCTSANNVTSIVRDMQFIIKS